MPRSKHYIVTGDPVALARARLSGRRFYDSQRNEKIRVGIDIKNQHQDEPFFSGPTGIDIVFYVPMPVKISKKKYDEMVNTHSPCRPDIDNLLKFIFDVCNGVLYADDNCIAFVKSEKIWVDAQNARTEFTLYGLKRHE